MIDWAPYVREMVFPQETRGDETFPGLDVVVGLGSITPTIGCSSRMRLRGTSPWIWMWSWAWVLELPQSGL